MANTTAAPAIHRAVTDARAGRGRDSRAFGLEGSGSVIHEHRERGAELTLVFRSVDISRGSRRTRALHGRDGSPRAAPRPRPSHARRSVRGPLPILSKRDCASW